jgi:ABC-type multidrug transport system ATPase subunit
MTDHVPATLHFSNISYSVNSMSILSHVTGAVHPGEIMAIMGASGAGKSTLLDILAHKGKSGVVTGVMYVNGRTIDDEALFRRVVGFVDQEDTLLSTLTVYETVLYSALLRLPREMSIEAKKFRTLETMHELGILGIKDSRIGESGEWKFPVWIGISNVGRQAVHLWWREASGVNRLRACHWSFGPFPR